MFQLGLFVNVSWHNSDDYDQEISKQCVVHVYAHSYLFTQRSAGIQFSQAPTLPGG